MDKPKTGTKTLLSPTTPEFALLEYNLQLCLKSTTAKIITAHSIVHPHLQSQFDRRCQDGLILDAWLDFNVLQGANTEEEVVRRGFQFDAVCPGVKVSVGSLKKGLESKASVVKKILFSKVGVGRAFPLDESQVDSQSIPNGYDSFYLKDQFNKEDYYHEYYIKESSQILPSFIIHYEYDSSKEKKQREKPRCDNCETETATVFCAADNANLCNRCDQKLHETKLASRHIRHAIGQGTDIFGQCRHHPDKIIEFFCAQCHIPVCVFCKMVGNHANGEAARHQLVSVTEAYRSVMQEAQSLDPIMQSRRNEINNQIAAIHSRGKAVEKMMMDAQSQIDEMHRRATAELKKMIKKKMNILLGDEMELKRQLGEMNRLEDFLSYQQDGDATQFLFSWSRHQKVRAELHDFKHFRAEIDVNLDVKVGGGIQVVQDVAPQPMKEKTEVIHHPPAMTNEWKKAPLRPTTIANIPNAAVHFPAAIPKKIQERRVQRRTSDFFAETLGAFDQFSIADMESPEFD